MSDQVALPRHLRWWGRLAEASDELMEVRCRAKSRAPRRCAPIGRYNTKRPYAAMRLM
jgi:hypothetical protein